MTLPHRFRLQRRRARRGATLVLAAFLMIAMLAMVAFAFDMGYVLMARTELQRSADAAASAAAWQLIDRNALEGDMSMAETIQKSRQVAASYVGMNNVLRSTPTVDLNANNAVDGEIVIGYVSDLSTPNTPMQFGTASAYNAVRVKVRRTAARNGQVPTFFARVLGLDGIDKEAESTAAILKNVVGFEPPADGSNVMILPIALDEPTWNALVAGSAAGNDDWTWDPESGTVSEGGDGVPETSMYPEDTGAAGNRGTINIGTTNNSTSNLGKQIRNGISPSEFDLHGGELNLSDGPIFLSGDPGISSAIKADLTAIIGQPRMIPIFRSVSGSGSNAQFEIVKFAGVRIMEVTLTGGDKALIVQPANVLTKGAIEGSSSSDDASKFIYSSARIIN